MATEGTGRLEWQAVTVRAVRQETPRTRTLVLDAPRWTGHRAGQHVDVRLTADDGYQAQRSYSIASASAAGTLELTVERLDDGEVSPWLAEVAAPGDAFELRGPIGGYFVWEPTMRSPVSLVAGGSGVVPLMAMLRTRAASGSAIPFRVLYSAREFEEVIYRDELEALAARDDGVELAVTLTRSRPASWGGLARRIDAAMLDAHTWPAAVSPLTYVCGPTSMVEDVATTLVELGHLPLRVRTERFGPSAAGSSRV